MKIGRLLIGALLIGILVLSPSAYAITISVGGDAGGFTENINAGDKDAVYGSTVIASNSLSHSIKGSGNLKESHWVSNSAGASAGVGVEIRKAESYNYGYTLTPGVGFGWPASRYPAVSASETLDVVNANYINAYANSFNAKGESAGVSTVLVDPGRKASLAGYSNTAAVAPDKVVAIQNAVSASAPGGSIQTEAGSQLSPFGVFPSELRMEKTGASTAVKAGSVNGYIDRAAVLNHEIAVSEQDIDSASGKQINSHTKSTLYSATPFNGLRTFDAEVGTMTFGTLTGYEGVSIASKDLVEAQQSGHEVGTFTSTATVGRVSKTRTSNYGTEYDFNMQAKKDASGSYATGNLGYYVDNVSPIANRIQGAVDASESGDAVNVAPGTYFENVLIDKSLSVKGAGARDTIVDGQHAGSVFTIGKTDPNVDVALSGMTIQGGSGTDMVMWPDYPPIQFGGGVWNRGTLSIVGSQVSGNTAWYGSGIWNTGNLTVESSLIEGNGRPLDGGGIWNSGNLIVDRSTITGNEAYWNGGGIWNSGNMLVEGSNVSGNTAYDAGGGIANDMGQATIVDSTISGNTGNVGGGILNNGEMTVIGGSVSGNVAQYEGGGIANYGSTHVTSSTISKNIVSNRNGGGVFNVGTATFTSSNISDNTAYYGFGGGIYNSGTAMFTGGNILGNAAEYAGGIYNGGTATFKDSNIAENSVSYGSGGGIFNSGTVTVEGSTIAKNTATDYGGGIYSFGSLNVISSTISENTAHFLGGGIYIYNGTATVKDSSILRNNAYYGGGIFNGGIATFMGSNISGNTAGYGGGIDNFGTVTVTGINISENTASYGGGIYNSNSGTVNLNDGSIDHNTAYYNGGGIYNLGRLTGNTSIVHDNSPDQIAT